MWRYTDSQAPRRRKVVRPEKTSGAPQPVEATAHASDGLLQLLAGGTIAACREIAWSSNYTFVVTIVEGSNHCLAVYKPRQGETPLWDFPDGTLYRREYAAYLVSEELSWSLIPPTVIREGPYGIGSVQLYIDADPNAHYLTFRDEPNRDILRLAAFDFLVNNADRKSGHCLKAKDGKIWAIDNGLTFHTVPKLRTVIWDFQGEPLPGDMVADLVALQPRLGPNGNLTVMLAPLIEEAEIEALRRRLDHLLKIRRFPVPGPARHYPWPLV